MKSLNSRLLSCLLALALTAGVSAPVVVQAKEGAAKASSSSGLKAGLVDIQAAILQTEQGKAAKARIEQEAEGKRKKLLDMQSELKKLDEDFQKQQSVLSEDAKAAKMKEFQSKMENLRRAQMNFEQEVRQKEQEETQKIFHKIHDIVDEVAKKRGYEIVFEKGSGAILYAAKIDDLTSEIVSQYNSRYKVSKK